MKILNSFFDGTSDRYEVSKAIVFLHSDTSVIVSQIFIVFRFEVITLEKQDIAKHITNCLIDHNWKYHINEL